MRPQVPRGPIRGRHGLAGGARRAAPPSTGRTRRSRAGRDRVPSPAGSSRSSGAAARKAPYSHIANCSSANRSDGGGSIGRVGTDGLYAARRSAINHHQECLTWSKGAMFAGHVVGESPAAVAQQTSPARAVRPRRGPLAGVRVADFCWMGVGSVATRLLADFGAEVIKIEDRIRIDTPRRLPIYKGEPARNFGEEVLDADPNRGGLFNNYSRNKLGVTINMRTRKGRDAGGAADLAEQRRVRELRPGRHGAVGSDLRTAGGAVARRHLRPDERLRALGPPRRVPQLRAGRPGGQRAVVHQRAPRPGAVGVGTVLHGQPGRLLQLGCPADGHLPQEHHRRGHRDRRVGDRGGHQPRRADPARCQRQRRSTVRPDFPTGNRLEWPDAAPTACIPRSATTAGSPSPSSTTTSGRGSSRRSASPSWTDDDALRHPGGSVRQPGRRSTSTCRHGRGSGTATRSIELLQSHGVPAGAVQNAEDLNERDPQVAHRGVFFEMDHPVIGEARFEGNPFRARPVRGPLALGAVAGRGQRVRVQADRRAGGRRVRRARRRGCHLMRPQAHTLRMSSTACGWSRWPATRPARCSASSSRRWAPTSPRSSRRRGRRRGGSVRSPATTSTATTP